MRFTIELISCKPDMVVPIPVVNGAGVMLPILIREQAPNTSCSTTFTVFENGEIVTGQDRREGWAYQFDWWTHHDDHVPRLDMNVTGSLIEVCAINPTYGRSYQTNVLVRQQD